MQPAGSLSALSRPSKSTSSVSRSPMAPMQSGFRSRRRDGAAMEQSQRHIGDELLRESNYVFGHYNLEAKPLSGR